MKYLLTIVLVALLAMVAHPQTYVFAKLSGAPVSTAGWSLSGGARVGNISGTGNSEIILCDNVVHTSGAVFYNQPINLNLCNRWIAEFDMRMYDGTQADGLAFCFLDVPPSGFINGGGLGIPGDANGLKVCFDTYLNCAATGAPAPKIELRWGVGYDECWTMPTLDNSGGALSFFHSDTYNHVKILYNNGDIEVYVNNTLYLSGFQQFNFSGYLGFTASTGGQADSHSIKNVVVYTDMPPSEAGTDSTICSGQSYQLGTAANADYVYTWNPVQGLSAVNIAAPEFTYINAARVPLITKYYVSTAFSSNPQCASVDSVVMTVLPPLEITIAAGSASVCKGDSAKFTATFNSAGLSPSLQWKVNGVNAGTDSAGFGAVLNNGDVVTCQLTTSGPCPQSLSNAVTVVVNETVVPSVTISGSVNNVCAQTPVTFMAAPSNGGSSPAYRWTVNGSSAGSDSSAFTSPNLADNDVVQCTMTANSACPVPATVASGPVTMHITPLVTPTVAISATAVGICAGGSVSFAATYKNGGSAPLLQWKKNGFNVGTNSTGYTDNALLNGDVISCTLQSDIRCITSSTAESNNIVMSVFANPVVSLNHNPALCSGAAVLDAGDFASYSWSTGSTDQKIMVTAPGRYYVRVTTMQGCSGSDTARIDTLLPSPGNFLPDDTAVCVYSHFTLSPLRTFASYLWSTGETRRQIEISEPGKYWLQVSDDNHCTGTDTIVYQAKDCGNNIYYPTAFTPNGDGLNEEFKPVFLNHIGSYHFSVFNRWGQVVFVTAEPGKGWDGTVKGTRQESQIFVWVCIYQFDGQPVKTDRGTIALIR